MARRESALSIVFTVILVGSLLAGGVAAGTHVAENGQNVTAAGDTTLEEGGTNLTVLMYNDIQTAASKPTKMGRLVGAINARQAAIDHPTVVVGGGDQVSPSSLSPVSNWTVPIKVLNVLDPAAEVIGNHDLDYGFTAVENFSAASEFPWLVANVRAEDGGNIPGTQNYTIVSRNGVKIGIVGLVDEAIKPKTAVNFDKQGYTVTSFVDAGQRIATKLKEKKNVDVVIAAAHIGVPESKELARKTQHIDVIVTGDDEVAYPPKKTSGTVIVEAKARASYIGEVNLTVTENDVRFTGGRLITLPGNYTVNETAKQIVAEARGKFLSKVAGRTTVPLDSRFGSNYPQETAWGNTITDAFIAETGADVALTNAGGIRGNFVIEPGNVTYNEVYTSLPFGNYLVTKKMTGKQLQTLLASQVTRLTGSYGTQAALQVSGVTYEIVGRPNAPAKISEIFVEGEPIKMDKTYTVTVNSYMAGWDMIKKMPTVSTDYTLYGTAVVDYIEAHTPISPPGVNRIRRVTRTIGTPSVSVSGDTATLTYDVPSAVSSINASTFFIQNATTGRIDVTSASLSDGTLTVKVDAGRLQKLSSNSVELELYGTYTDSEWHSKRNAYAYSKLNGDVVFEASKSGAADPDGDDLYEDVNADGEVDIADVQLLFGNLDAPMVEAHPDAFDFDGDGDVDVNDVIVLFEEAY